MPETTASETSAEELLEPDDIQGNSLSGFNKDHQVFLYLKMERDAPSIVAVRAWLRALAPQVSSVSEVHRFNELFRSLRRRSGRDPHGFVATWLNIAFSAAALRALTSEAAVERFTDPFFQDGLAVSSGALGDPIDPAAEGHPDRWFVGGTQNEADILLIIASDSAVALAERVAQVKTTISQAADPQTGLPIAGALHILWEDIGETLPTPLTGHEHFGFKDGISQPGVRGLLRRDPDEYLMPRLIDPAQFPQADPTLPEFSRPGQPLVWPGQFVFGYNRQNPNDARKPINPDDIPMDYPDWGRNGSYLVVRRLRQDVRAFRASMRTEAKRLSSLVGFEGMTAKRLASLLVGRWPGGAPVSRSPQSEDTELSADSYASNYFQFVTAAPPPPPLKAALGYHGDTFPTSPRDSRGTVCPLSAHIRKVNPRDTVTEQGNSQDTLTRLILRRGIPFGPAYPGDLDNAEDTAVLAEGEIEPQRGLIFASYQTSIANQFVFLQANWANHPRHPNDAGGEDPIIGHGAEEQARQRFFDLRSASTAAETLNLRTEWVIPTGGGFFFSPSISVLTTVLGRS